jgi:hypothetical protein
MAFETYPKNGQKGSRHVFSGEESKAGWDRREYPKKGHSATKFGSTKMQGS